MKPKHKLVDEGRVTGQVQSTESEWPAAPRPIDSSSLPNQEDSSHRSSCVSGQGEKHIALQSVLPLSSCWFFSMSCLPRSQEIGQQSRILVYYFRDKHNGQDNWTSLVNLFEPSISSKKIKIIAKVYLVSIAIAKRAGLEEYFTKMSQLEKSPSPSIGIHLLLGPGLSLHPLSLQPGDLQVLLWLAQLSSSSWEKSQGFGADNQSTREKISLSEDQECTEAIWTYQKSAKSIEV